MYTSDPVNRIMTQPVLTVGANELLEEVLRLFVGHRVHHLPVVEDGHVVGMLSSVDIAKLKSFLPPPGPAREALLRERWQVRKIMRSPAITITEYESTQLAAQLMADNGIHSLPVVNSKGALIGIVTTTAMRNLNAGQDEHLHTNLLRALHRADLVRQEAGLDAAALNVGG
jgi:acetoin utilization protein AcuB